MGYESTLVLGLTTGQESIPGGGTYVQAVAMIDLSKCSDGPVARCLSAAVQAQKQAIEGGALIYGAYVRDGDSIAVMDPYGDPLAPVDLDELIAALEADNIEYRRFALALYLLRGWRDLQRMFDDQHERALVLHYGH